MLVQITKLIDACILDELLSETVNVNPDVIESIISAIAGRDRFDAARAFRALSQSGGRRGPMATAPGLAALDLRQEAFDPPSAPHLIGGELRGDWLRRACAIRQVVSVHVSFAGLRIGVGGSSNACIAFISKFLF
ncbi:hypothetical protein [Burkholderia sp. Bp9099]|uniref:hypothetical protein n=1 Tax=Burkholderia sp. Bp9099 TaxID=2184568 RepID=UPI000F5E6A88|nr:hypothetical protein [Burkholderia sp. Bp9099]